MVTRGNTKSPPPFHQTSCIFLILPLCSPSEGGTSRDVGTEGLTPELPVGGPGLTAGGAALGAERLSRRLPMASLASSCSWEPFSAPLSGADGGGRPWVGALSRRVSPFSLSLGLGAGQKISEEPSAGPGLPACAETSLLG